MKKSTLAAVLGNVISLLALWLVNFGIELTAEQQAEIVSALLLIVNTCALVIPAVIAGLSRKSGAKANQAGNALPPLLLALGFVAMVLALTPGCTILPKTPAQQLAYADASFTALVESAADLRDQGALTTGQVDRLSDYINRGNDVLSGAWAALGRGDNDRVAEYAQVVSSLLVLIRNELEAAQ